MKKSIAAALLLALPTWASWAQSYPYQDPLPSLEALMQDVQIYACQIDDRPVYFALREGPTGDIEALGAGYPARAIQHEGTLAVLSEGGLLVLRRGQGVAVRGQGELQETRCTRETGPIEMLIEWMAAAAR